VLGAGGAHSVTRNAILHAGGIVDYRSNVDLTETPLANLGLGEKLRHRPQRPKRILRILPTITCGTRSRRPAQPLGRSGNLFAGPEKLARQYAGQERSDRAHGISDEKEEVSGGDEQNSAVGGPGGFAEPGTVTLGALGDWNKVATTLKDLHFPTRAIQRSGVGSRSSWYRFQLLGRVRGSGGGEVSPLL
jgi:hypothetical protein